VTSRWAVAQGGIDVRTFRLFLIADAYLLAKNEMDARAAIA